MMGRIVGVDLSFSRYVGGLRLGSIVGTGEVAVIADGVIGGECAVIGGGCRYSERTEEKGHQRQNGEREPSVVRGGLADE